MNAKERAALIPPLDRFVRSMGQGSDERLEAYRACYETGSPLIPEIVKRVRAVGWMNLKAGYLPYISALMGLLHDIDESASRDFIDEILKSGAHRVIAVRLRSIRAFTLRDFEAQTYGPLDIYVAKTLPRRDVVWRYLNTWLSHIPAEDLEGIDRLYVIKKDRLHEAWGLYQRVLSVISLVWRPSSRWNWFARLQTEHTLYHEVGHHADKRTPAWDGSREAVADTYAERTFRKAHPKLGKRWFQTLIRPIHLRRKLWRVRQWKGIRRAETSIGSAS